MDVVLVPVGPAPAELDRARDVVASVRHFEPGVDILIVDDAPRPRPELAELGTVLRSRAHPKGMNLYDAVTTTTLVGLRAGSRAELLVKLDTDALVIGPFIERLRAQLHDADVVGRHDRDPGGAPRDFSSWREPVRRATRVADIVRGGRRPRLRLSRPDRVRVRREIIRRAHARGYVMGEHCLGGAYAVGGEFLSELNRLGWVRDERCWTGSWLAEDVVVGLLCRATSRQLANSDVFGIRHIGLLAEPDALIGSGFAIIHSVKNHRGWREEDVRSFFRARRDTAAPPAR